MICPKYDTEYPDGKIKCEKCDEDLVEKVIIDETSDSGIGHEADYEYLMTVNNDMDAEIIESLLASFGIPVAKKYEEAGDVLTVYMGFSNFGVELYVPANHLDEAKDITSEDAVFEIPVSEGSEAGEE